VSSILREHRRLAAFFIAYYLFLIGYGFLMGETQTLFYAVFVGLISFLIVRLHASVALSPAVLWGLALWGLAHMIGGLVHIGGELLYERSLGGGELRFDKLVHFFGFGFATLAAFELVRATVDRSASVRALAVTAFFVGLGAGAVNETVEFLITLLPGESNVGGFSNTGWDLVANALGAATAASLAPWLERGRLGTPSRVPLERSRKQARR
jgi:uncharacterized membrane protein YjdF